MNRKYFWDLPNEGQNRGGVRVILKKIELKMLLNFFYSTHWQKSANSYFNKLNYD